MGLIAKIKSVLGVAGNGEERPRDSETTPPIADEPETTNERAVKGTDQAPGEPPVEVGGEPSPDEPADTGDRPEAARSDAPEAGGEPVDSIKGIGSAYAQRLADAGVESIPELARADPEELAAATGLGTGRVGKWIERARARTE